MAEFEALPGDCFFIALFYTIHRDAQHSTGSGYTAGAGSVDRGCCGTTKLASGYFGLKAVADSW
jgi:hypothetical protein